MNTEVKDPAAKPKEAAEQLRELLTQLGVRVDGLNGNLDQIKKQIADYGKRIGDCEVVVRSRVTGATYRFAPGAPSLPGLEDEKRTFYVSNLLKAMFFKDPSLAEYEIDVCKETAKRRSAQQRGVHGDQDSKGGYLLPVQVLAELIPFMREESKIFKLGVRNLLDLSGTVHIPKQTGGATIYWVGEESTITESAPTFGQVTMSAKIMAALVPVSESMLRQSSIAIEPLIRQDLVEAMAEELDKVAIESEGGQNKPRGLVNIPGISTKTVNGAISPEALKAMKTQLRRNKRLRGSLGWLSSVGGWEAIENLKDGQGRFFLAPDLRDPADATPRLFGHPAYDTLAIPENLGSTTDRTRIIFGNWADMLVGNWGGLRLAASDQVGFKSMQVYFRADQEVDVQVRHPESFVIDSTVKP